MLISGLIKTGEGEGGEGEGGWEGGTWGRKFFSKKISGEDAYQGPKRRILNLCNFIFRSY